MKATMIARWLLLAAFTAGCAQTAPPVPPVPPTPSVAPVLATDRTVLGQPIAYPAANPMVTAVIVTLPPGAETGWHRHPVPLFGFMLEGELTVAYEGAGERVYRPGEALMEAISTPHNGHNRGDAHVRILAVFIGAEYRPNSEKVE